MFEQIQQSLLEFIHFHEICHKFFYQDLANSIHVPNSVVSIDSFQQLLPYYPQLRGKLEDTLQQAKLLCETNIHCLAKISILQQEKQDLSESYELRIQQLEEQVASLTHALDHQKTLQSNYSQFASLHGYWKAILNHSMVASSSSPSQGNHKPQYHLQPELSKSQITEIENICAKLLNWLAIDSFQTLMKSEDSLSLHRSRSSHEVSPKLNRSLSFHSMNQKPSSLGTPSYDATTYQANPLSLTQVLPGVNNTSTSDSIVVDSDYLSSYKEWTNQMIREVKQVKEACYQLVLAIHNDQQEKQSLQQSLKESKHQTHRLYEKYAEMEKDNERLQMKNEELRMIAHNNKEKVWHHDKQLRQLFEILQFQHQQLQESLTTARQPSHPSHEEQRDERESVSVISSLATTPRSRLTSSVNSPAQIARNPSLTNIQPVSISRPLQPESLSELVRSRSPSPQRLAVSRTMSYSSLITPTSHNNSYSSSMYAQPQSLRSQSLDNSHHHHAQALQQALQQLSQEKIFSTSNHNNNRHINHNNHQEDHGNTLFPMNLSLLSTSSPSRSDTKSSHHPENYTSLLETGMKHRYDHNRSLQAAEVDQSLTYSFSSTEDNPFRRRVVDDSQLLESPERSNHPTQSSNTSLATTDAIDVTLPSTISYRSNNGEESVTSSISSHHHHQRRKDSNQANNHTNYNHNHNTNNKLPLLPIEVQNHRELQFHLPVQNMTHHNTTTSNPSTSSPPSRTLHAARSFTAAPLFFASHSSDDGITLETLAKL